MRLRPAGLHSGGPLPVAPPGAALRGSYSCFLRRAGLGSLGGFGAKGSQAENQHVFGAERGEPILTHTSRHYRESLYIMR